MMSGVPLIEEKPPEQILRERRVRIGHLQDELARIGRRREILDELEGRYEEELKACLAAEDRRAAGMAATDTEAAPTNEVVKQAKTTIALAALPDEKFRDAVLASPCFTITELAWRLKVTADVVRERVLKWLDEGKLRSVGKFQYEMMYEYVPPTEPGVDFEVEQVTRRAATTTVSSGRGAPVPYTGKPMGASGKPGRDREKARQGRRIKTKHGKA